MVEAADGGHLAVCQLEPKHIEIGRLARGRGRLWDIGTAPRSMCQRRTIWAGETRCAEAMAARTRAFYLLAGKPVDPRIWLA